MITITSRLNEIMDTPLLNLLEEAMKKSIVLIKPKLSFEVTYSNGSFNVDVPELTKEVLNDLIHIGFKVDDVEQVSSMVWQTTDSALSYAKQELLKNGEEVLKEQLTSGIQNMDKCLKEVD